MENHKDQELSLEKSFRDLLDRRRTQSTLRNLTLPSQKQIDFSSNDFLSLSKSPVLRSAFLEELSTQNLPLASGGSRLLDGNSLYAENLEKEIAKFHGAEAGLLFNSGFDANAGFFACVPQPGDVVVFDELIHASVHDGMRLSRAARRIPFAHNSIVNLEEILRKLRRDSEDLKEGKGHVIVAVEAVYSMDGDLAPLKAIVETVERVLPNGRGYVVVDEAHSTGIIGPYGRGLVSELGLETRVFARLHTFGKALACNGGEASLPPLSLISVLFTIYSNHSWISIAPPLPDQLCASIDLHDLHVLLRFSSNSCIVWSSTAGTYSRGELHRTFISYSVANQYAKACRTPPLSYTYALHRAKLAKS